VKIDTLKIASSTAMHPNPQEIDIHTRSIYLYMGVVPEVKVRGGSSLEQALPCY